MLNQLSKIKLIIPFIIIPTIIVLAIDALFIDLSNLYILIKIILFISILPLIIDIIESLLDKRFGVDVLALTSILGSIVLEEYLAAAIIILMLSGGEYLEDYAIKRSKKALTKLLSNTPKIAHRKNDSKLEDIEIYDVKVGDILVVKKGEVVPVDGLVLDGNSELDEASLTGESVPILKKKGMQVMSGSINLTEVIEIETLKTAENSKYQQIVELVKEASKNRAPFVRLADKYSVWFTILAYSLSLLAYLISNNPVQALSVLVVATPCPLILATPIAFSAGINKAATLGVIFKSGGVIERLAKVNSIVFDKTGTLTLGELEVTNIKSFSENFSSNQILEIAGSLDQYSNHVIAKSIVKDCLKNDFSFSKVVSFNEILGKGVSGVINDTKYLLGNLSLIDLYVSNQILEYSESKKAEGVSLVFLASSTEIIGAIELVDTPRSNLSNFFNDLKILGINNQLMLTGDKSEVAKSFSEKFKIEKYKAELLPEDKVSEVKKLKQDPNSTVVMIGDGVNDAPALSLADVGIAMGDSGSNSTTEAADVVISVPDITKVKDSIVVSKKVLEIALQSILVGIGLSTFLMILGVFGFLTPVSGALYQEIIDVLVILNALRVVSINV